VKEAPELILSFAKDEKLKDFTMDLKTTGNKPGMDMMPPPFFAQTSIPFNYAYVPPLPPTLPPPLRQPTPDTAKTRMSK